jgi:hypothetical protein
MKKIIFVLFALMIVASCTQSTDNSAINLEPDAQSEELLTPDQTATESVPGERETVRIFQSDQTGVVEYLKCITENDGKNTWYYSTAKNKMEIKLGVISHRGMETLYFLNSPKVDYEIDYVDCGFMLGEGGVESQLYSQVIPACE